MSLEELCLSWRNVLRNLDIGKDVYEFGRFMV
jgi:hypothetical protein